VWEVSVAVQVVVPQVVGVEAVVLAVVPVVCPQGTVADWSVKEQATVGGIQMHVPEQVPPATTQWRGLPTHIQVHVPHGVEVVVALVEPVVVDEEELLLEVDDPLVAHGIS
jgi:hypothetical protein